MVSAKSRIDDAQIDELICKVLGVKKNIEGGRGYPSVDSEQWSVIRNTPRLCLFFIFALSELQLTLCSSGG